MNGLRAFTLGLAAVLALGAVTASAETRAKPEVRRAHPASHPLATFTPSLIDAPGLALKPGATVDARQFRFTPSGKHAEAHAVTLVVRARPVTVPDATHATHAAEQPAGYDVGMAVGTRGLTLSGGMRRLDVGIAQREAVTLGLGYNRKDWSTSLKLGEESNWARGVIDDERNKRYSVELGTAYSLGRDVRVGAGVRYRVAPATPADTDARPPADRSAFVGLGIAF